MTEHFETCLIQMHIMTERSEYANMLKCPLQLFNLFVLDWHWHFPVPMLELTFDIEFCFFWIVSFQMDF